MNAHILSILRFTAAIIVILSHQQNHFKYLNVLPKFFLAGPQMVTFFFVLSGFVLVIAYGHHEKIQVKKFLVKRITKIYPLYFISLFLCVCILTIQKKFNYLNLIVHLALIQSWIPPYPLTINSPAWYLSALIFCYITFPLVISFIKKCRINPSIFFYMSLLIWFLTQAILTMMLNSSFYQGFPSVSHDFIFYFPLSHYCSFLLGVTGALMIFNQEFIKNKLYAVGYKPFFIILIIIIIIVQYQNYINEILNIRMPYEGSLYAPLFLLLIGSVFFIDNNRVTKSDSLKVIELLGLVSYPLYILQGPVSYVVFFITKKYQINGFIELAIYLISLFIISTIFVKYINKPLIRFCKNALFVR